VCLIKLFEITESCGAETLSPHSGHPSQIFCCAHDVGQSIVYEVHSGYIEHWSPCGRGIHFRVFAIAHVSVGCSLKHFFRIQLNSGAVVFSRMLHKLTSPWSQPPSTSISTSADPSPHASILIMTFLRWQFRAELCKVDYTKKNFSCGLLSPITIAVFLPLLSIFKEFVFLAISLVFPASNSSVNTAERSSVIH